MCVVCRESFDKRELHRLVFTPETGLIVDHARKTGGRGAYLCANPACWERARQSNVLDHALRAAIPADEKQQIAP